MKKGTFLIHFLILLLFGFFISCSEDDLLQSKIMDNESEVTNLINSENFYSNCLHFNETYEDAYIGCVFLQDELTCEDPTYQPGFGAKPFEMSIGDYTGLMSSIVRSQRPVGQGKKGVDHLTLTHHFVVFDEAGDIMGAFWTEDKAVCTPGTGEFQCRINDQLTIIGGCGIFEGAYGKYHNNGILTFTGEDECLDGAFTVPSGFISGKVRGKLCLP